MLKSNNMEFELTPEITEDIIFAMEDQTTHYLFDSVECVSVSLAEREEDGEVDSGNEDDERYYSIPVWDSISGYKTMDHFVSQLRNPVAREQLRSALAYGHGVFRNFKNILKNYSEVERFWYQFKEREMKNTVLEWYNCLRDFWGLERVGAEPEETGEIVSQEFMFRLFEDKDALQVEKLLADADREVIDELLPELKDAIRDLCSRIGGNEPEKNNIMVVESAEGSIVGCSVSSPIPKNSLLTVQMTQIAVIPEFRGLGVGKELLTRTIDFWSRKGYRWFLFTSPFVPLVFLPVLHRIGFVEKGHVSILDLRGT